ncbi:MAG: pyridoxal phosphate-dependent aminotransferase [Pseudomonadota bacterium]
MIQIPDRFPHNDILSLTAEPALYDLAESVGPDLKLSEVLQDLADPDLASLPLAYSGASGHLDLRELIAQRHGVRAEEVIVMAGGMQALFLLAHILCAPGDDAVIAVPIFPNAKSALQSVSANIREVRLRFENGYRLDEAELRAALTPGTKLISLASPQNPSGVATSESEVKAALSAIDEICPGAVLLLDETYREAVYGDAPPAPSAVGLHERIVSCGSLSKCHGAPGLRTGWAITQHEGLRRQLMLGKFNTIICNSVVDDALAIRVLQHEAQIVGARRPHLQAGFERTRQFVADHSDLVDWVAPDAGALCCLRLNPSRFDEAAVDAFYAELKTRDVRVGNGAWFGEEARVFRLGFGLLTMVDFEEALSRLSDALYAACKGAKSAAPLEEAVGVHVHG